MSKRFVLAILVLTHVSTSFVACQISEPIHFPTKGESCNVVQVNCGEGRSSKEDQDTSRNAGPPGKAGPNGPKGSKGDIGITGQKGEKGESVNADVLEMLSVTSCQELNERFGVNKTGFYLMRIDGSETAVYRYCDFYIYQDNFTCYEMYGRGLFVYKGQYRYFRSGTDQIIYVECSIDFPNAVYTTCHTMSVLTGQKSSGHYNMTDGESAFEVYCNFASGSAVTEVVHDFMNEIFITNGCEDPGCYSWIPQYKVNSTNMAKIVSASASCKQYIKYRCQGSVLLYGSNSAYGWWVSSGGEKMNYWGGATSQRTNYCACGETGSCDDRSFRCNCDDNEESRITQDEGFLTDKSKLPVREMRFGDMGGAGEKGWHTLGKLECTGQSAN